MPSPTPSPAFLAAQVEAEKGLPEEIVKAIEALQVAAHNGAYHGPAGVTKVRSVLDATILHHLSAANKWAEAATEACDRAYIALGAVEDERDAARVRAERAEKALEDLQGAFHESSDAYAKIAAVLSPTQEP